MAKKKDSQTVKLDDIEYSLDDLSENAKAQIVNIQFVDNRVMFPYICY